MQLRSQEDGKMSSAQCLHWLLFSISLLLYISLSASSTTVPSPSVHNSDQKYAGAAGNSNAITESLAQGSTVTSSIQPDTITTESPSFSQNSIFTTIISPSSTQDNSTDIATTNSTDMATTNSTDMPTTNSTDMPTTNSTDMPTTNSTDMATTPLPVTTDVTPTIKLTTTENSPTSPTQFTPFISSTSVPPSQSAQTTVTHMSTSGPTETVNTTSSFKEPPLGLSRSEAALTIFCGLMLGLTVLAITGYSLHRCKQKSSQYIHQPLYNSSEDTGDRSVPDDTLVISGGLYDGPEIFNSSLAADEDMGFHSDPPPFAPQPAQFRLEFLSEAQPKPPPKPPGSGGSSLQTFQPFDAND
ncbi:sialomucin core protein 24-like [Conger conger]|uniref:sialomucin core protein 24-like n=1 Tax=Conger conger TaxID=82655 RepID=UPI002A5A1971|nr:sialomucin core protein 24-like [Conger conger]